MRKHIASMCFAVAVAAGFYGCLLLAMRQEEGAVIFAIGIGFVFVGWAIDGKG